jgi:Ner family transcriptional regulator
MMASLFRWGGTSFRRNRLSAHTISFFSKENFLPRFEGLAPVPQEAGSDWHPADILAALKKRGFSLVRLSTDHGYHPTAAGKALKRSWPAMEAIIADAIGVKAEAIWPSRYATDRLGKSGRSKAAG